MAICNSIPAEMADRICSRISNVATQLRALRTIAIHTESEEQYEALATTVEGISERCHVMLDECIVWMGQMGLGNFRPNFEHGVRDTDGGAE